MTTGLLDLNRFLPTLNFLSNTVTIDHIDRLFSLYNSCIIYIQLCIFILETYIAPLQDTNTQRRIYIIYMNSRASTESTWELPTLTFTATHMIFLLFVIIM